jgi:hypothetical protein
MTRPPATIHVKPVDAAGNHRASPSCPCRPILAVDLMDGPLGKVIYIHRHAPEVTDATTPTESAVLLPWMRGVE